MSAREHAVNSRNNFIAGWYMADQDLCRALIEYHRNSAEKHAGMMTGNTGAGTVNKDAKDSTDVTLQRGELANRYIRLLNDVAREYIAKYPYCNKLIPWGIVEPIAIQHYLPGGGYKVWHFERDNRNEEIARRHLAFMTYLNTVDDGGGTMFHYQDLTIKAEAGLTLIWPGEWTHTHKGEISPTQEKYIVTGWFSTYTLEQFRRLQQRIG
jgi:prolyl 4-hydroxylase